MKTGQAKEARETLDQVLLLEPNMNEAVEMLSRIDAEHNQKEN